jgi:hypothetical protein
MRTRTTAVVAGLGAALSAGLLSGPATAGGAERVDVRDDCEPRSFNAALFPGACDPEFGGDTTFQELGAALSGDKGARAMEDGRLLGWRNNAVVTELDRGESLHAVSRGGEFHTFSRVDDLGGGCLDDLNKALDLPQVGEEGNNCRPFTTRHAHPLPAGATVRISARELTRGKNLYQCLIHPWMHTTVHVH